LSEQPALPLQLNGVALQKAGDLESALDAFQSSVLADPSAYLWTYYYAGELEMHRGNILEAEHWFRESLNYWPKYPLTFLYLGLIEYTQQEYAAAADLFDIYRSMETTNGGQDKFFWMIENFLNLNIDNEMRIQWYLEAGDNFREFSEIDEAIIMYVRILEIDSENIEGIQRLEMVGYDNNR